MPHGVKEEVWRSLPQEDKDQIIAAGGAFNDWDTPGYEGHLPTPVKEQPQPAAPQQQTPTQATSTSSTVANPSWVFAVNLPSTYPDFAAMKQGGAGIVVVADDPNAQLLIDAARQWGVPVAIQVNAPSGITAAEYAQRVADAKALGPDKLVLDVEVAGKGYGPTPENPAGSAGWNFSNQVAALIKPIVGDTPLAVTMEPNQADYNYKAYTSLGAEVWVQSYLGDMTPVDPATATAPALAAVPGAKVIPILAPGQKPTGRGLYASFGIPTTGATVAGVYGGYPQAAADYAATHPGSYVPGTGPGYTAPPATTTATTTTTSGPNWADAYFGTLGLPPDVQNQVNNIFKKYPDDPQLAITLARQLIHTTPWFATAFPGYFEGIRTGLFTDESGYRGYVNQANVYTHQYFNRQITTGEVESALSQGISAEILGRTFEAGAIANANAGDWKYQLGAFGEPDVAELARRDPGQTTADLGKQQAGISSMAGTRLQAALERANKRMSALFGGQLAIPNTAGQALAPRTPDLGA